MADEKTCETCRYTDKRADQEPCNSCTIEDGDKWEQPDPDEKDGEHDGRH